MVEGLAQRLHDFFIDDALAGFLMESARPVVGIMGGSRTLASDRNYRRVVELAASLTQRGYLVVGGGGLGIMEAANLGAYLADRSDAERHDAVQELAQMPGYAADEAGYLQVAVGIRERFAPGGESLAIPTWVSEGEPISQFASHIAKYFSNSIREDGMLAVATAGIVFAPGDAGTMQEIFQDAAQNAYKVFGRSPMVFLDRQHHCADTGLYPALQRQAERLGFADLLSVADEPAEILDRFPARSVTPGLCGYAARRPDAHAQLPLAPEAGEPVYNQGLPRARWMGRTATIVALPTRYPRGAPCSRPSSTRRPPPRRSSTSPV